jgi:uncharacterized protein (TIRG00374 family)
MYMTFRTWLSVITLIFIGMIVFFSRHELEHAWKLLETVNIWILLLIIPIQIFSYYTNGEMLFSYLRSKKSIENVPGLTLARMSLEMNFVNHILPSGGMSGISYMGWRLGKYGVSQGRAAMAQAVRFSMGFIAYIVLLMLAVIIVTIDTGVNRWVIFVSSALTSTMIGVIIAGMYLMNRKTRIEKFAHWLDWLVNTTVRKVTFGRIVRLISHKSIETFFNELRIDYDEILLDKKILIKPLLWGVAFTIAEVSMFWITFAALGAVVNPAPILIAYGVASSAGFFVVTPGGAGAYEAIMIAFLAIAGLSQGTAIAGIVLTRVILLLGTIILGYLFYQHALVKYGKDTRANL